MAKIIRHNGEFAHYEPGIIYDLGIIDSTTNTRIPFYVGETSDPAGRLEAHKRAGKNADEESTLVYQTIRALNDAGIEWTMETLVEFGKEGPTDLEDEWIMEHLYDGYKLKNMKKGNANWMANREACKDDMRHRGIRSFRKYKEVISLEEKEAEAQRKHSEWMRKEEEKKHKEFLKARSVYLENLYKLTRTDHLEYCLKDCPYNFDDAVINRVRLTVSNNEKRAQAHDRYMAQQERARAERQQLETKMEEFRAEQMRLDSEKESRQAKLKAEAAAKWAAEQPAREARLKAEAEAFQAREEQRLKELHERKVEEERRAKQSYDEFVAQANIDQAEWPEEDRIYHQRMANIEWAVISKWPKAMQDLQKELDRVYHARTLAK